MLKTVALSAAAALVIAVDWLRFEEPRSGGGRPFVLAALAIGAVLLRPLWLRLVGVALAALIAVSVAFSLSPLALWPGGDGFFGPIGSRFSRGFLDFYDFRLPFDPTTHPAMHSVILVAIFGFTLAVALAVASRHALLAVVFFFIGAGWPATLLSGGNELGRGIAILAVALALLAGMTERPSKLALIATGAVIACALALSSSPAVAKSAFLDWQHWDFYTRPQKPVSVKYIWDARYDGVHVPEEEDDRVDDPRAASALLLARHHPRSLRRNALARARVARNSQPAPAARTAGCARPSGPRPAGGDRRRPRGQPRDRCEHAHLE